MAASRPRSNEPVTAGSPRAIHLDDVPAAPWRNGGGVTRELLAVPEVGPWSVRVSVADIESDGPFSCFPAVTRCMAVLCGAGVELEVSGRVHRLDPSSPAVTFDGDAAASARLIDGPVRDLNLMVTDGSGSLSPAVHGVDWIPAPGRGGVFAWTPGRLHASQRNETWEVPARTLVWFDELPASLRFEGERGAPQCGAWWLWSGKRGRSA